MPTTRIKNLTVGQGQPLLIIGGPCVAESRELCLTIGTQLRDRCAELGLQYIFKASYDKANRSSITSARGPGLDAGLDLIADVGRTLNVPTTSDIHLPQHAAHAAERIDLLQIPAFLSRQTDLLVAAAQTDKPVNVKKGQFLSPHEMTHVIQKLTDAHAAGIMLTERGTFFGYHRLVNDFVGLGDMIELGPPVCFDVTHSTQQPGAQTSSTGGRPERAPLLAKAAVVAGVHALFIETHPDPASAASDAASMLPLEQTLALLPTLARLHQINSQTPSA